MMYIKINNIKQRLKKNLASNIYEDGNREIGLLDYISLFSFSPDPLSSLRVFASQTLGVKTFLFNFSVKGINHFTCLY